MKANAPKRIAVAWMLLMTIMFLIVVKTTHCHEDSHSCCCTEKGADHVFHDDCLLCHFMFCPFIGSEPFHLEISFSFVIAELICYAEQAYSVSVFSYDLRAPPFFDYHK